MQAPAGSTGLHNCEWVTTYIQMKLQLDSHSGESEIFRHGGWMPTETAHDYSTKCFWITVMFTTPNEYYMQPSRLQIFKFDINLVINNVYINIGQLLFSWKRSYKHYFISNLMVID